MHSANMKIVSYCCVISLYDCSEHMDMGVSDYMSVLSCQVVGRDECYLNAYISYFSAK